MKKAKKEKEVLNPNATFLEVAKQQHPDVVRHIENYIATHKLQLDSEIELEFKKEEKIKKIEDSIQPLKAHLQHPFYIGMGLVFDVTKNLGSMPPPPHALADNFKNLLANEKVDISSLKTKMPEFALIPSQKKDFEILFKRGIDEFQLSKTKRVKPITKAANENIFRAYMRIQIYYDALKKYYLELQNLYNEYSGQKYGAPKFQWKGSQRDLAELFIELDRRGYLTMNIPKIQIFFTGSNTIDQLLNFKGEYLDDIGRYQYPKVYTAAEKNKFDKILPNPKRGTAKNV